MSDNGVPIDLHGVIARVKQWLAEGNDIRVFAVRPAVPGFPMIEMRDGRGVEVVTNAGVIRESTEPPCASAANNSHSRTGSARMGIRFRRPR